MDNKRRLIVLTLVMLVIAGIGLYFLFNNKQSEVEPRQLVQPMAVKSQITTDSSTTISFVEIKKHNNT